jgi:hypothetical protein
MIAEYMLLAESNAVILKAETCFSFSPSSITCTLYHDVKHERHREENTSC